MSRPPSITSTTSTPKVTTGPPSTGRVMILEDLFALPGHSRIWTWPTTELKKLGIAVEKKTDKRYFFRVLPVGTSTSGRVLGGGVQSSMPLSVTIEMCRIERIFEGRKTNYDEDVVVENMMTIPATLFENIKYLTSVTYRDAVVKEKKVKRELEEREKRETRHRFIVTYLPTTDPELKSFVQTITREYCTEMFGDISVFNIDLLAATAIPDFQNNAYWFSGSNYSESKDQNSVLEERMFYNHYPLLSKFAAEISKICQGKDFEADGFQNSLTRELNFKYNSKLVDFVRRKCSGGASSTVSLSSAPTSSIHGTTPGSTRTSAPTPTPVPHIYISAPPTPVISPPPVSTAPLAPPVLAGRITPGTPGVPSTPSAPKRTVGGAGRKG